MARLKSRLSRSEKASLRSVAELWVNMGITKEMLIARYGLIPEDKAYLLSIWDSVQGAK